MGAGQSSRGEAVVGGRVAAGYESVREMFAANLRAGREEEAQLCVYVGEECVVDLWGSASGDISYTGDSLQCVFSSSKAVTAVAVAQLVERHHLSYTARVADYWPEFAAHGKAGLLVADLLRHEAGIPHLTRPLDYTQLAPARLPGGAVANILAAAVPQFPVSTKREYHNLTAGWALGELCLRVSPGRETLGAWLEREVATPLAADVFLPVPERQQHRVRDLTALTRNTAILHSFIPNALGSKVEYNFLVFSKILQSFEKRFLAKDPRGFVPDFPDWDPSSTDPSQFVMGFLNSDVWRGGESPHGSVHASARGLARVAAAMAGGGRLGGARVLSPAGHAALHSQPVVREDASMGGCRTEFTQGGVNMFNDYADDKIGERILKSGRDGFVGWLGFGGSVCQWHPGLRLGFGYACTLVTWWDLANTKVNFFHWISQGHSQFCHSIVKTMLYNDPV